MLKSTHEAVRRENTLLKDALHEADKEIRKHSMLLGGLRNQQPNIVHSVEKARPPGIKDLVEFHGGTFYSTDILSSQGISEIVGITDLETITWIEKYRTVGWNFLWYANEDDRVANRIIDVLEIRRKIITGGR